MPNGWSPKAWRHRRRQRFSRGESGQLNLGYLFKFNYDLLPATLATFRQTAPEIAVNLFDMPPTASALEARKIDLGFVGLQPPPRRGTWLPGLGMHPHHQIVVVLPSHHALAKRAE